MLFFRKSLIWLKCLKTVNRFAFSTKIAQKASSVEIKQHENLPKLIRKPDSILIKNWWCEPPFEVSKPLTMPIFNFKSGEYTGQNIDLDHTIFNQPLRRDLVHRVYEWRRALFKKTTHIARDKGTTAGSGKKPFQQKGSGRARQGNKRAPGRWKGGKAHGPKPREYAYPLCKKVRLTALKALLSAKLAEGKIRIIDSEALEEPKTRVLSKIIGKYGEQTRVLLVTSYKPDKNTMLASQNIQNIALAKPNRMNVLKLLACDKLIFTVEGLHQATLDLNDRTKNLYRNRKIKRSPMASEMQRREAEGIKEETDALPKYDPSKPLEFKFKILENYYQEYEKKRQEKNLNSILEEKKE